MTDVYLFCSIQNMSSFLTILGKQESEVDNPESTAVASFPGLPYIVCFSGSFSQACS